MTNEEVTMTSKAEEPALNIQLTVQEVNIVLGALQELPHRVVDPVLKKIVAQAQSQMQQQAPVFAPAAE